MFIILYCCRIQEYLHNSGRNSPLHFISVEKCPKNVTVTSGLVITSTNNSLFTFYLRDRLNKEIATNVEIFNKKII